MTDDYSDLLHKPHHVSSRHPRMSMHDRAGQFAPFAALVGYEDSIGEAGRYTEEQTELGEDQRTKLDGMLAYLSEHIGEQPVVRVTHFVRDERKSGGAYQMAEGALKKLDIYNKTLTYSDGRQLKLDMVASIELI